MRKKVLFLCTLYIASLSLILTGCKNDEPDQPAKVQTYHVTLQAGKGDANQQNGPRKALGLDGTTLTASWAAGEQVSVRNLTKNAPLEGSLAADSAGVQTTISGDLTGTINAGDVLELTFLSPAYTSQEGTLDYIASHCDYAVATIHVESVTWGSITFQEHIADFENRQAIVKFTLMNEAKDAALNASKLEVEVDGTTYTVTPASATSDIFVALPGFTDQTVKLTATVGSDTYTSTSSAKTLENGKYYAITVGMPKKVLGFSISPTQQIEFAHGNLQYNKAATSTPKWRIAEHQYDIVGDNVAFLTFGGSYDPDNYHNIGNVFIGSDKCSNTAAPTQMSEDCWIDLLSWQGKDNIADDPLNMSMDEAYFIQGDFEDWGKHEIYDPLSGDTYSENTWYTLSRDQWEYIFFGRDNAGDLCTMASIDGVTNGRVKGIMLLPDDFVCPSGITPPTPINAFCNLLDDGSPYYQYPDRVNLDPYIDNEMMINSSIESSPTYMYNKNCYTVDEWEKLEAAGAVFLPAAGRRERRIDWGGDYVMYTAIEAAYWTSTLRKSDPSYVEPNYISANAEIPESLDANKTFRANCGLSVRLVRDLVP